MSVDEQLIKLGKIEKRLRLLDAAAALILVLLFLAVLGLFYQVSHLSDNPLVAISLVLPFFGYGLVFGTYVGTWLQDRTARKLIDFQQDHILELQGLMRPMAEFMDKVNENIVVKSTKTKKDKKAQEEVPLEERAN